MKCPKCRIEMTDINNGFGSKQGESCNNRKCWFYGIIRYVEKEVQK